MHDRSERAVLYRIGQLERANRRMAAVIFLLGGAGFLTVILGMAFPDSQILEAERIVIKDRTGKVRAAFGVMDASGSPRACPL